MTSDKVSVGDVEIVSLSDCTDEHKAARLFPKVSEADWDKYPDVRSSTGTFKINYGCFALRCQDQTILIDTGMGPGFSGRLPDELLANGLNQHDISVVALTHLHRDHVGWNITEDNGRQRLTFPKARYWVPKADWEYYRHPQQLEHSPHIKTMVLPLERLGGLELVEGETSINSEVTMVPTPGHTPGHMSIAINSQGQRAFILGDVVHFPFQIQETAWEIIFNRDQEQARMTREAVLEQLEDEGSLVAAGHFMPPNFGRVVRRQGRRYWQVI